MTDNEIIKALENCMNGGACVNCPYQGQCETGILAEVAVDLIKRQQAEIERLKKDSPPCKLGDVFYKPVIFRNEVDECKVSLLRQRADGSWKIRLSSGIYKSVFEITPDRIGKTVFLTKEEAEEALEKQKK